MRVRNYKTECITRQHMQDMIREVLCLKIRLSPEEVRKRRDEYEEKRYDTD